MKYQSMKCSCNPEPTERGALVFSRGELERRKIRSAVLSLFLGFVCLTSLKLKYEGNVSESRHLVKYWSETIENTICDTRDTGLI